jgi:hypothetical protein
MRDQTASTMTELQPCGGLEVQGPGGIVGWADQPLTPHFLAGLGSERKV